MNASGSSSDAKSDSKSDNKSDNKSDSKPDTIRAAGTVPWRIGPDGLEVALIHRPAYNDWSWPKGKLEKGEQWPVAAARETFEEMGLVVRLGAPLPDAAYGVPNNGKPRPKIVRYWAARVIGGKGELLHEVDEVRWLTPSDAARRLTYERDNQQLDAVVTRHEAGTLETAPLLFVRHALAVPRKQWKKRDQLRPLNADGAAQAKALPPLLRAYGVVRLVSSTSERCATTFLWAEKALHLPTTLTDRLTEEGFAGHPGRAHRALDDLTAWNIKKGHASAVCTHGPLIPSLLSRLAEESDGPAADVLLDAAKNNMTKGEAMAIHLAPRTKRRRILAVERHQPLTP